MAGCCGCTLQTSAIVAAVFGMIESVVGFITGLAYLSNNYYYYSNNSANVINNVLISATVFNALWLIATIILIIGIVKENATMHRIWVGATSVIMIIDLAHSIALAVGIVNLVSSITSSFINNRYTSGYRYTNYYYYDASGIVVFILLMTAVSRSSIWLWIINICLTIYTAHRATEIERGPVPNGGVIIYGGQPGQTFAVPGQTIIVQHGGLAPGMPPSYGQQPYGQQPYEQQSPAQYGQQPPAQYGQQPPAQYGQAPVNPYSPDQGVPAKY